MPLQNAFGNLTLDTTTQQTNTQLSAFQQILQPLQRIAQLLKPLGLVTTGTNRLNVDVNNITTLPTLANVTTVAGVTTVTTVTTVSTLTNQSQIGAVNAFAQIHDISRQGYNAAIRGKIS